ncbi:hypothetical protein MRX96_031313 [Rhipicephalus microplus]
MSEPDLDELRITLCELSLESLQSLGETEIWWLPDLRGMPRMQTINLILGALRAISVDESRAFCLAWFYCCLAERNLLTPWREYRVAPANDALTGKFVLHERLESALQYPGGHTTSAMIESGGMIYACVMATSRTWQSAPHDVICLQVIRSTSQLFVHVLGNHLCVINTLQSVLRGNATGLCDSPLGQLTFAFAGDNDDSGDTAHYCKTSASYSVGCTSKTPDQTVETDKSTFNESRLRLHRRKVLQTGSLTTDTYTVNSFQEMFNL